MQSYALPEAMLVCTHVLADRLQVRDWPNGLPWQDAAPEWLGNERHLLPAVLRLDQLDDTQHEEVARCLAVETASAILIRSDLSADALARRLARHVTVTLADDSAAVLRFADPGVFIHLLWVLPLPHLASLCDGASGWWVPHHDLWHELQFRDRPEAVWSRLDEAQSIALTNVGLVNDTLATLPAVPDLKQLWRCSQEINQWLCVAQSEFGLACASDCVAFARHGCLLGDGFTGHPKLAPYLHEAATNPGLYAEASALLEESDWDSVIDDIEQMNRKREVS
ncbi:DUF4123 domain-containing protein [Burkholderia pseudomultivorans]|uniref:DUF4123 domain-containing protein n=1 Tax=Burkholderia pseudomultivorans TaxID=1207504 RepID=UPI00075E0023|nr:DUF4123 domain-containing protein [Burkholderia pseudomultivorans]KVG65154.1 hypothetical protein WS80_14895 [Burkholderia pseudomultivorans]